MESATKFKIIQLISLLLQKSKLNIVKCPDCNKCNLKYIDNSIYCEVCGIMLSPQDYFFFQDKINSTIPINKLSLFSFINDTLLLKHFTINIIYYEKCYEKIFL